jgi:hypothetical protein
MESVYHVYDEATGKLYLDDGREFPVNPRQFCSVDHALRAITSWARRNKLIGVNDDVVAFI